MRRLLLVLSLGIAAAQLGFAEEPRRLVDGFGQAFSGGTTHTGFAVPSTSGRWFLTVQRSSNVRPKTKIKLNGQTVVNTRDFRSGQRVLRVPIDVQLANTLQVRVYGSGSLTVRVQGVVKESRLPAGVGQRVAKTTVERHRLTTPGFSVQQHPIAVDQPGLYTLQVQNGRRNGSRRVWWASVVWNQEFPFGFWALTRRSFRVEAPVVPNASNTVTVWSIGSYNSFVVLRLKGWVVDEDAPTVAWSAPAAGSDPGPSDPLRVTFADPNSGIDADTLLIELNGTDVTAAFTVADGEASATLADLPAGALVSGANTLSAEVQDRACNLGQASVQFQQGGVTPAPVLSTPGDLLRECTGAGTPVQFTVSATDANDPAPAVVCTPSSGSSFPLGSTLVTCVATNSSGESSTETFTVTVQDTRAPFLGQAAPAFLTGPTPAAGAGSSDMALADLNADGNPDLVVAQANGAGVHLSTGVGTFDPRSDVGAGPLTRVALADLNGDGRDDLVALSSAASSSCSATALAALARQPPPLSAATRVGSLWQTSTATATSTWPSVHAATTR